MLFLAIFGKHISAFRDHSYPDHRSTSHFAPALVRFLIYDVLLLYVECRSKQRFFCKCNVCSLYSTAVALRRSKSQELCVRPKSKISDDLDSPCLRLPRNSSDTVTCRTPAPHIQISRKQVKHTSIVWILDVMR